MLQKGILNPAINELLCRIRHTNTLVIADWAFPYWQDVPTIDLSLTKGIPLITDVLDLLKDNFKVGHIWQAEEFLSSNPQETITTYDKRFEAFKKLHPELQISRVPHLNLKKQVPNAIGLIRTGDPTAYGNIILQSI